MKILEKKWLWWSLQLGLGTLFLFSSFYKIASPSTFAHQIYNYKILPAWGINPLAILLPWVQLFCGLALLINKGSKGASLILAPMMLTFQIALASALLSGLDISCGCFRSGGDPATWLTFGRDTVIFTLTALLLWQALTNSHQPRESGDPVRSSRPGSPLSRG
ncbi:MAG: DoxX family protein [Elusimicrobia bacterium]|nr:DoxX family protein [Candidatus Obscuribacterium magneticum]